MDQSCQDVSVAEISPHTLLYFPYLTCSIFFSIWYIKTGVVAWSCASLGWMACGVIDIFIIYTHTWIETSPCCTLLHCHDFFNVSKRDEYIREWCHCYWNDATSDVWTLDLLWVRFSHGLNMWYTLLQYNIRRVGQPRRTTTQLVCGTYALITEMLGLSIKLLHMCADVINNRMDIERCSCIPTSSLLTVQQPSVGSFFSELAFFAEDDYTATTMVTRTMTPGCVI